MVRESAGVRGGRPPRESAGVRGGRPPRESRHVVLAPDKFKGSLTAAGVAEAVAAGLLAECPEVRTTLLPVADGGDGTVAAALAAGFSEMRVQVEGPTGEPVQAPYALDGERAVVELAAACGLDLLPNRRREPLRSSTYGLGQVMADAVERGATQVVLGVGGSASTDGGAGMLAALGARLLDESGTEVGRGAGALTEVAALDLSELRRRMAGVRVVVASDVDNPLLGPRGAAAVFGPQKGANAAQVDELEHALTHWAALVEEVTSAVVADRPGTGSAGGTGFAALAVLDAQLASGIDLVLDLIGFAQQVVGADLVITGEGSLDEQTLSGKAPIGVTRAATRAGVPVVAVAGRSQLDDDQIRAAGLRAVYPLSALEPDPTRSIAHAAELLTKVGHRIGTEWLRGS